MIKTLVHSALFALLISLAGATYGQVPQIEREALVALYNSTDGANWTENTGWLGEAGTECDWFGVTCSSGVVTRLIFPYNSLTGTIPTELGNLTSLTFLDLSRNSLTGSIPSELGDLKSLTILDLGLNSLSGTIPTKFGNLSNLTYLSLSYNSLSGAIPSVVTDLPNLETTGFAGNLFIGPGFTITEKERDALIALYKSTDGANWKDNTGWLGEVGTECDWFGVACLSGTVTQLILYSNSLNGSIPREIGNLTGLTILNLSNNTLSGIIPSEIGNLTSLTYLSFFTNSITGAIPREIGNLTKLTTLQLAANSLSGSIPSTIGNLTNLTFLGLWTNQLSGSIPRELGNLTGLTSLNLSNNTLSGMIPSELGKLTKLEQLLLGDGERNESYFTAPIPESVKNLPGLVDHNLGRLALLGKDFDYDGVDDLNDDPNVKAKYRKISKPGYSLIFSPSNKVVNYVVEKEVFEQWLLPVSLSRDKSLTNIIYENFDDSFDFIMTAPNISASCIAYCATIKSVATGLGRGKAYDSDRTSDYGSKGRLKGFIYFNNANFIKTGPSLHEIVHIWALPEMFGSGGHAGDSNLGGILGGWKPNSLRYLSDGTYQIEHTNNGAIAERGWAKNFLPYSNFELYLMGLIGPDEVGHDLIQANDAEWISTSESYNNRFYAGKDIFSASSLTTTTMDQFIEKYGPRVPDHADSQKEFEALYVVISEAPLTREEWIVYDNNLSDFQSKEDDGFDNNYNFWEATQGKASISFSQAEHVLASSLTIATSAYVGSESWIGAPAATSAPAVLVVGGDKTVSDTDNAAGESVSVIATATDSDGTIATMQWLVDGVEVATGLSATLSLPNGPTVVTFKATDNDGESSTTTATIIVEAPNYAPTEEWPSPYNGVTPDTSLGLAFNNIGIFNTGDATIYACLRLFTNGLASSSNGISQFDIGLKVVSLSDATVQIVKSREFNTIGALNEKVQTPDCSGIFETTTGLYTDILQANTSVLETVWSLIDSTKLILKLISSKELTAN